eukprot:365076-Chlamydomonas_euryale.AAC.2
MPGQSACQHRTCGSWSTQHGHGMARQATWPRAGARARAAPVVLLRIPRRRCRGLLPSATSGPDHAPTRAPENPGLVPAWERCRSCVAAPARESRSRTRRISGRVRRGPVAWLIRLCSRGAFQTTLHTHNPRRYRRIDAAEKLRPAAIRFSPACSRNPRRPSRAACKARIARRGRLRDAAPHRVCHILVKSARRA